MMNSWQNRWRDSTKGRWTKYFFGDVNAKRLRGIFHLNQLFAGHGAFKAHQARLLDKDKCFCGKAVGAILHTIKECKLWESQRKLWLHGWTDMKLKTLLKLQLVRNSVIQIVEKILTKGLDT
ncbi:hypothetical protein AVEN_64109-1 [Araneus ventricosus]|uniref:Reverse transcriptase zinc-binding domain-containing protein n=1 Tax=Araneus ventricosus TaxID=182803 RepID=A0A4Y2C3Y3_ARAVE|nr:hypothetical protein AVEN_64109-1 [Araneus ventricosus]